jgi:N-acyl-L-homoserine lactone synthetase
MLQHLSSHTLSHGPEHLLASVQTLQNSTRLRTVMDTSLDGRPIAADLDEYSVVVADTSDLIEEVFRLRYQVYCIEKGYEPGRDGMERDEYDDRARHVLLVHRPSGQFIGTVRVIPSFLTGGVNGLPMIAACGRGVLQGLPTWTTGEISRFAVSKRRRLSCRAGSTIRLGLMQGTLRLSRELGLTHWCAIMEPALLRLLQMNGIYFSPRGPVVEYHGLRQPASLDINTVVDRTRVERRDGWNYVTAGGTLWQSPFSARLAA